ncbi:MAG: hypothetical protein VKL39_16360 [Leptolyngbyaceae bacterium]|nr:hypothetical protein [Leptolyngbyaceae bacterium]
MQMFTPYNPDDLRRIQEERRAAMAAQSGGGGTSDFLKNLTTNDVRQLSDLASVERKGGNQFQIGVNTGRGQAQYLSVDDMGNLLNGQTVSSLSAPQFDAYNRLLAQLRSVNR